MVFLLFSIRYIKQDGPLVTGHIPQTVSIVVMLFLLPYVKVC